MAFFDLISGAGGVSVNITCSTLYLMSKGHMTAAQAEAIIENVDFITLTAADKSDLATIKSYIDAAPNPEALIQVLERMLQTRELILGHNEDPNSLPAGFHKFFTAANFITVLSDEITNQGGTPP
jgi:hypothetical protein